MNVTIDRDKAGAMGVNANQIENALYDAYGPRWVSTIYGSVNEYKVLLELEPQYQADPRALSLLYFKNTTGKLIPLDTLASFKTETGPQTVNHYGQIPAATISFNLKPGAALGSVVDEVQELADRDPARHHQHAVPGRGQGLPELAGQPLGAADHRHHGGVHRARHSVRKLHPPASRFSRACRRRASARCSRWWSSIWT